MGETKEKEPRSFSEALGDYINAKLGHKKIGALYKIKRITGGFEEGKKIIKEGTFRRIAAGAPCNADQLDIIHNNVDMSQPDFWNEFIKYWLGENNEEDMDVQQSEDNKYIHLNIRIPKKMPGGK